ncbi:lyase family protein [Oleidesulfovibrio sp.]|uniref:lyase family protein n=1 Tax=Oleidesulfovibrio sp. TaxID=2909707 RepID=UPI003A8C3903
MRIEHDALGSRELPDDSLFGIHTLRASENFPLTPYTLPEPLILALVQVKLACARTNAALGYLDSRRASAIESACAELLSGQHRQSIVVDPLQGGAGTSANMNVNEVIANRACQLMGGKAGEQPLAEVAAEALQVSIEEIHSLLSPKKMYKLGFTTDDLPHALRHPNPHDGE